MEPMLYTVKEVAQILKCNATRVYGLKDAGLLPFLKLGQLKCRREAVEEFLRKYEGYDVSDPNNIIPLEQGWRNEGRNEAQRRNSGGNEAGVGRKAVYREKD